ncbi:MATE family efflux transporter [Celerinatantimonas diazotrophica]|uniref:Multidrug export protein MepA n=1 Tax=Celerinatantimonas diazotrophica TaxID=412034 RepID=A0A4R1K6Y0_9GAMM|nr:MATE family efflux transporter [Celerinatantimonas diazotrophica]TCK58809.1 putative MATE family efflux protein [Celerinatantimonas diazotrophica]CAG9297441.1 Multidrug export protein MepA [Celerinatantimonas diazotrophica]
MQASSQFKPSQSVAGSFWRFAIPSIIAMLVSGLYQIIDGFFVGHYVGADGLAGINMAIPLLGLIMGFGLLIGMGGGSVLSNYRGENNLAGTQATLVTSLCLIIWIGLLATVVFIVFGQSLLNMQGATGVTLAMSWDYVQIMSFGALISIGASAMPMLVRNDNSPNLATVFIVVGALANIVLDYFFLGYLDMGLKGAAIATLIAQLLTCVLCLRYFISAKAKTQLAIKQIDKAIAIRIVQLGASNLVMFIYFSFVMAFHNMQFMAYGNTTQLAAFAIVGYLASIYYFFAEGLVNGLQPPVSYYLGAKQYQRITETVKLAFSVTVGSGIALVILLNLFPELFISIFTTGNEALFQASKNGIRLHLMALYLDGFLFMASIYFVAVGKSGQALFVSVGNMLIQLPFLFILPKYLGIDGVWLAVPLSNIAFSLIVLPMLLINLKGLMNMHQQQDELILNKISDDQ